MNQKVALAAILVAMAVFAVLQARGGLFGTREDVRSAAYLKKVAAEVNRTLPKMVDSETEMTSVDGLDATAVYNYRLVNVEAASVNAEQLVGALKPQVTKAVCAAPQTRDKFLRQGITLRYTYADKNGQRVASFDVVPTDCP